MRLRLTLLSFVLCGAVASEAPAQDAARGGRMFGGGRGARGSSAPRGAAPSRSVGGSSFFGSRGASSAPRSSGGATQFNWRSNSSSAGSARSASAFSNRATPRYSAGQTASGNRNTATPRYSSGQAGSRTLFGTRGSARDTGRTGTSAGAPATDTRSPFARNLSRSSSGSQLFGRGTAASPRSDGTSPTGTRSSARGVGRSPDASQVPADTAARRAGQTGFSRPSSDAMSGARRGTPAGRSAGAQRVGDAGYRRYGYYPRPYSTYPDHYRHGYGYPRYGPYYCSPYYASSGFYLGFTFGVGAYLGFSYYYPWYHCGSGVDYAFFYGVPVSYCYVPYGFYCDAPTYYVTRYVYVQDTYPTTDYEAVEAAPPAEAPAEDQKVLDPEPAAGSPVAEKYLRDASEAFRKADYLEAAKLFRLAALSSPENAAPYFALGQSLIALGSDAYAAKVIRKAVVMNPGLAKEPGDIVGVFKDQAEFERVMGELAARAEASPAGSDARFLLAAERYFSGDPKAAEGLAELRAALPGDKAVEILDDAAKKRFAAAGEELPPVAAEPK